MVTGVVAYFNFDHGKQGWIMNFQQLCIRNNSPICTLHFCACVTDVSLPECPYTTKSLSTLSIRCRGLVQHAFYKEKRLIFSQMGKDSGANETFGQRRQLCQYTLFPLFKQRNSLLVFDTAHVACVGCLVFVLQESPKVMVIVFNPSNLPESLAPK